MNIKIGVVGLGDGGVRNLESIQLAGARVIAACDTNAECLDIARLNFKDTGIEFYHDVHSLIRNSDVDLLVVATPDHMHIEPMIAALEAGKYVFIEKPAASTIDDLAILKNHVLKYPGKVLFSERFSFAHPIQAIALRQNELGCLMTGSTFYVMSNSDRIMGNGKWRTEHAYNPCAGGLSHNFMTALLFTHVPIVRVSAIGQVLTYHENLDRYGGYDTMNGVVEFETGVCLQWVACIALRENISIYGHRDIAHVFQFENGALVYGSTPSSDRLQLNGKYIDFTKEPESALWEAYSLYLYRCMHEDILKEISTGEKCLHNIIQGMNVAAACIGAFESAKRDGSWFNIPPAFIW